MAFRVSDLGLDLFVCFAGLFSRGRVYRAYVVCRASGFFYRVLKGGGFMGVSTYGTLGKLWEP